MKLEKRDHENICDQFSQDQYEGFCNDPLYLGFQCSQKDAFTISLQTRTHDREYLSHVL